MSESAEAHRLRMAVARATRNAKLHPDDTAATAAIDHARTAYAVKKAAEQFEQRLDGHRLSLIAASKLHALIDRMAGA